MRSFMSAFLIGLTNHEPPFEQYFTIDGYSNVAKSQEFHDYVLYSLNFDP